MIYIIIGIVILLLVIIVLYYEDFKVKITKYNISDSRVKNDFKIIQISDFHNTKKKWVHEQVINTIKKEKPDIIVITGDLIDKDDCTYSKEFIKKIYKLSKIYYVPGNHEYIFGGYPELKEILLEYNVNILGNEYTSINDYIDIYGVKDPDSKMTGNDRLYMMEILDNFKLNDKKYSILLSHRPELFDIYTQNKYDLVFAGHAHGGQVIMPLIGPLYSPHQGVFPKYARGIIKKDNTKMIVSRGLGNSLFAKIRINNRPELVIVSLSK